MNGAHLASLAHHFCDPYSHHGPCAFVRGEWERASGLAPWCLWTALSFKVPLRLGPSVLPFHTALTHFQETPNHSHM